MYTMVMHMAETVSVRIDKPELKEIEAISKIEKKSKSSVLREVLEKGIMEKKLDIALAKFRNNEATAWKAARIASRGQNKAEEQGQADMENLWRV